MSDRWISRASNRLPRTAEVPISSPRHAPTSTAHSARALQQAISHSTPTPHSTAKASTGVSPRTLSDALRWTGRRGRGAYCGPTLRTPSGLDPSSPPRPPILTPPNPRLLYSHTAGSALGPSGRVAEPDASQMRAATCATARHTTTSKCIARPRKAHGPRTEAAGCERPVVPHNQLALPPFWR